jgi:hypothetical protein
MQELGLRGVDCVGTVTPDRVKTGCELGQVRLLPLEARDDLFIVQLESPFALDEAQ